MIASRIHSDSIARAFLKKMGPAIAEDGYDIDKANIDTHGTCWLMIHDHGHELALFKLTPVNTVSLEIHINVLPEFRDERREIVLCAYRWILEFTGYQKLIAWVPALHKHIKRFAVEMGMVVEGNSTASYRKDGVIWDQWLLGIDREGMGKCLA